MGIPVYCIQYLKMSSIMTLGLQVVSGVLIYLGLSALLRLRAFEFSLAYAKALGNRFKRKAH